MSLESFPLLRTRIVGNRIRLELGSWAYGYGRTVEEASNDLLDRMVRYARALRERGFGFTSEMPAPDPGFLELLWEVGELADCGNDVRSRIFRPAT
jgi:hypothetical protein